MFSVRKSVKANKAMKYIFDPKLNKNNKKVITIKHIPITRLGPNISLDAPKHNLPNAIPQDSNPTTCVAVAAVNALAQEKE